MTLRRVSTVVAIVLVAVVTLGVTTHAAAGEGSHSLCLACSACEWLNAVLSHL